MKVARLYLRVSTDEQDLTRQSEIEHSTRAAGYYIAGIYREKASGARPDRPELLRMITDLQSGEVVVAEKIGRISRLPLAEAEQWVGSIRAKGAKLAVPGLVDLSECAAELEVRVPTPRNRLTRFSVPLRLKPQEQRDEWGWSSPHEHRGHDDHDQGRSGDGDPSQLSDRG